MQAAEIIHAEALVGPRHQRELVLQEFEGLKVKELKRRATELGAGEEEIDDLLDEDDPRGAIIALILQLRHAGGPPPPQPEEQEQEQEGSGDAGPMRLDLEEAELRSPGSSFSGSSTEEESNELSLEERAAEAEADRSTRLRSPPRLRPEPSGPRKFLEDNVYPTLRPSLIALDRCRPSEEHANPDFRMTPSKFLARCLSDPSFLANATATKMDHDVNTGLLTFMMSANEALREAVQEVSRERPVEPLALIARRLAD